MNVQSAHWVLNCFKNCLFSWKREREMGGGGSLCTCMYLHQFSSPEPLDGFWRHLVRKKYSYSRKSVINTQEPKAHVSYVRRLSSVRRKLFSFPTSSQKPLNRFWRNLTGSQSSTSSTKFVFFVKLVEEVLIFSCNFYLPFEGVLMSSICSILKHTLKALYYTI